MPQERQRHVMVTFTLAAHMTRAHARACARDRRLLEDWHHVINRLHHLPRAAPIALERAHSHKQGHVQAVQQQRAGSLNGSLWRAHCTRKRHAAREPHRQRLVKKRQLRGHGDSVGYGNDDERLAGEDLSTDGSVDSQMQQNSVLASVSGSGTAWCCEMLVQRQRPSHRIVSKAETSSSDGT